MKFGLQYAHPVTDDIERALIALAFLFAMFAIPVLALVSSMHVFGERLTLTEWLGIASIGFGLAIVSLRA